MRTKYILAFLILILFQIKLVATNSYTVNENFVINLSTGYIDGME
jgi:hypothetical protein